MKKYRQVAAIIVSRKDKFLLVRKPRQKHAWQFPQGGADAGESLSAAAKRELWEECGGELRVHLDLEKVGYYQYDFPEDFLRHHGEFVGAHVTFFRAECLSGEPKADGVELVETRWCTKKEIKELVSTEYFIVVESLLIAN